MQFNMCMNLTSSLAFGISINACSGLLLPCYPLNGAIHTLFVEAPSCLDSAGDTKL